MMVTPEANSNSGGEGKLIWITGLAGSGKTLVAERVYNVIKEKYPNTLHLDGDYLREILGEQASHDLEGRKRTAKIYSKLCSFLTNQGINVVISTISLFHHIHEYNRKNNKNYYEIFLDVDKEVLVKRNKKELYIGDKNNVMGINQEPEFPKTPHLILKNNNETQLNENISKLLKLIENDNSINMVEKMTKSPSTWDYTAQAKFYDKRPNYSLQAIDHLCKYVQAKKDRDYFVADIGAGTGNLTILLHDFVGDITAVEPTEAMKQIGLEKTKGLNNVKWISGTGENTTLPSNSFDMVTFGSSFNTTNRIKSLQEAYRILKPEGFFVCMWNNRDLTTPTQKRVEEIIQKHYPGYSHGTRREQQADVIIGSGLFDYLHYFEVPQNVEINLNDFCEGWRSVKNTFWDLSNPEGIEKFEKMIKDIKEEFKNLKSLSIVYITKVWVAQKR